MIDYFKQTKKDLEAGTGPDVFYVDSSDFPKLAPLNALEPLEPYMKNKDDAVDFFRETINGFKFRGKLYGLPKDFSNLALFYNKDLFDKNGVKYPTDKVTWTELRDIATKFGKEAPGKAQQHGMVIAPDMQGLLPVLASFGANITGENLSKELTSPAAQQAYSYYVNLRTKDKVAVTPSEVGASWDADAFGSGKIAMMVTGAWVLGHLKSAFPQLKFDVVPMPSEKGRATPLFTTAFCMSKATKSKKGSWALIEFLTDKEAMKMTVEKLGVLSARKSVMAMTKGETTKPFYASVPFSVPWKIPRVLRANIEGLLRDAFAEKVPAEDIAATIAKNYEAWDK